MKLRTLGKSDIEASVVGLGTWVLGGGTVWGQDTDDAESVRAIQAALDAGINLIDTAPGYGFGRCEEVVGRGIAACADGIVCRHERRRNCPSWQPDPADGGYEEVASALPSNPLGK